MPSAPRRKTCCPSCRRSRQPVRCAPNSKSFEERTMIGPSNDLTSSLALDTKSLGNLKQSAKAGTPEALKGAATQFEAMFINMMMKSMREASPGEGMGDSEQSKTFTSMLDQQFSQNIAKRGVGLADMLTRQLSSQAANTQALALTGDMNPTLARAADSRAL